MIKEILKELITDTNEMSISRHEAILAYAYIFGKDEFINEMEKDECKLVAESAQVVN